MKKIVTLVIMVALIAACYDDYILDYDYNGIFFPYQVDVRTFVVGEGMKIEVGAALGGVRSNDRDRIITFQIDNSLITNSTLTTMKGGATYIKNSVADVGELKLIPSNYISMSDNSRIVIKKGNHSGTITIRPDSARFLADAATLSATYALPLRILTADADTVLQPRSYPSSS